MPRDDLAGAGAGRDPYVLLGNELRALVVRSGRDRKDLAGRLGVGLSVLDAALYGRRRLSDEKLKEAARFLVTEGSPDRTADLLCDLAAFPYRSRVHLARGAASLIHVGVIEYPPFATFREQRHGGPTGVLADIVNLLFGILELNHDWRRVTFENMARQLDFDVDLVVGFVLATVRRQARSRFVSLPLPFSVGINAITGSESFSGSADYDKAVDELRAATARRTDPVRVVVLQQELADEYFPAIVRGISPTQEHAESIDSLLSKLGSLQDQVVFVDHISCRNALARASGLKLVFKQPIGSFAGGFLLPSDDPAWAAFFETALNHFMRARLPVIGEIIDTNRDKLLPFLPDPKTLEPDSSERKTLQKWHDDYWPHQLQWPRGWPPITCKEVPRCFESSE